MAKYIINLCIIEIYVVRYKLCAVIPSVTDLYHDYIMNNKHNQGFIKGRDKRGSFVLFGVLKYYIFSRIDCCQVVHFVHFSRCTNMVEQNCDRNKLRTTNEPVIVLI